METKELKNYEKVAEVLRFADDFMSIKEISEAAQMAPFKVKASMALAKRKLARESIIIINEMGQGYRIGNFKEFENEVNKSCSRAIAHLASMAKYTAILKATMGLEIDVSEIQRLLHENLRNLETLFENEQPLVPDFIAETATSL